MGKSFSEMHPELASEFSERNLPLTVSDITYGSNKKYWWIGKCEHEWLASPKSRHSGEGCPYCAGMRVLEGFNDLASIKPELVDEWSSENEPLKPNNVNAASHRKVKWKGKCGHEWTAEIRARVKGTGCPYCSNNKIMPGFNDLAMKKNYDYILIDCMPSLGMMTVNALAAADSVIIPSQPNFLSTKGLNLLLRSIAKIKRQINPRLRIDGILLTMVDNRTNNAKTIITSLRSSVGENIRVFESEIPFSVRAAECSLSGESIFSHDKNGKVAAAYEALTKEVTEIEERAKNRPGPDWIR